MKLRGSRRGASVVLAIALASSACSSGDNNSATKDTSIATQSPPPAPAATATKADDCPATGKWALCSVEKRLKRSGFVATRLPSESPARPGFSVKPAVYTLGRGRLEVFIYDDARSMEKDIASMDTLTVSPAGAAPVWPSPAGLIRNGNLAAVYMDQSSRQAERLLMALTAGAPSGG